MQVWPMQMKCSACFSTPGGKDERRRIGKREGAKERESNSAYLASVENLNNLVLLWFFW